MTTTLLSRLDSFGDVLLAGPAVRAAAAHSERVVLLCGPQGEPAARLLPGVDEVLVWEAPWVGTTPPEVARADVEGLVDRLADLAVDTALVLTSFHQSPLPTALLLRMAGARWIAADCVDYPGSLLDLRHQRAEHAHEARAALDLAHAAGLPLPAGDDGRLRVRLPRTRPVPPVERDCVVLHPGASVPARRWSARRCAEAVRELSGAGHRVVVTGGVDERGLTAEVAGFDALDLGGRTDPAQLAALLSRAGVVVTGNTGPAHLAAAVGTPVVSLFAPVVPAERWAPFGVPTVLLGDQRAPCANTRARECPVPGHPCLESVTGTDVLDAVHRLLGPGAVHASPDPDDRPRGADDRSRAADAAHRAGGVRSAAPRARAVPPVRTPRPGGTP